MRGCRRYAPGRDRRPVLGNVPGLGRWPRRSRPGWPGGWREDVSSPVPRAVVQSRFGRSPGTDASRPRWGRWPLPRSPCECRSKGRCPSPRRRRRRGHDAPTAGPLVRPSRCQGSPDPVTGSRRCFRRPPPVPDPSPRCAPRIAVPRIEPATRPPTRCGGFPGGGSRWGTGRIVPLPRMAAERNGSRQNRSRAAV